MSRKYLKLHHPFDLSRVPGISGECQRDAQQLVDSLKRFELWALKSESAYLVNASIISKHKIFSTVLDSSAKLPSGVLNGNVNQFGDFDQCLSVEATNNNLQGKYCVAYLQPTVSTSLRYTNYLRKLLQSYDAFRSNFDDVSLKIFRFRLKQLMIIINASSLVVS